MSIVPFTHAHVLPAATLVAARVERLRRRVPVVPRAWTDPAHVARVVSGLADSGTGLAALDDGALVAFQAGSILDGRGGRWTFTPDVGHVAPPDPDGRVLARLYAGLADGWARAACTEHVVAVLADDEPALAAFARLGFGHHVVDLVGDLAPVRAGALPEGVTVRRAGPSDAVAVGELDLGLRRHLEASPVFLRLPAAPPAEVHRRRLEDDAVATFVAEREGVVLAFLRIGPCANDVASIVRDAATASITAAFTRPDVRRLDVASHLLRVAIRWADQAGYARWAVDHESANPEAGRFWARHATPVVVTLQRRLSPTVVP